MSPKLKCCGLGRPRSQDMSLRWPSVTLVSRKLYFRSSDMRHYQFMDSVFLVLWICVAVQLPGWYFLGAGIACDRRCRRRWSFLAPSRSPSTATTSSVAALQILVVWTWRRGPDHSEALAQDPAVGSISSTAAAVRWLVTQRLQATLL